MTFWDNVKRFWNETILRKKPEIKKTDKGFQETQKEPTPEIPKKETKELEEQLPQIKEEKKVIKRVAKEEEIPKVTQGEIEKEEEQEITKQIPQPKLTQEEEEKEEEIAKELTKATERKYKEWMKVTESSPEIKELIDKSNKLRIEGYQSAPIYTGTIDGQNYAEYTKNAILGTQTKIDEELAEIIVQNAEKMRGKFTTEVTISTNYGTLEPIKFIGGLIHEVHPIFEENFQEGMSQSPSGFINTIKETLNQIQKRNGITGIVPTMPQYPKGTELEIYKPTYKITYY